MGSQMHYNTPVRLTTFVMRCLFIYLLIFLDLDRICRSLIPDIKKSMDHLPFVLQLKKKARFGTT